MKISRYSIWTQILTFTFSPPVAGPAWECPAPPSVLHRDCRQKISSGPRVCRYALCSQHDEIYLLKIPASSRYQNNPAKKKSKIFKVPILTGIRAFDFGLFMGFLVFVDRRTNAMDLQGLFRLKKLFVFSLGIVDCCLSPDNVIVWWLLINAGRSVRRGARSAPLVAHCHLSRGTKRQVLSVD